MEVVKIYKFVQIYTEEERETRIKKEKTRLNKIFKDMENSKKSIAEKLIDNAVFMAVALDETKKIITRDGVVEEYQNGMNQCGIKKSSAVEVYDKMLNTYSKIVKQLCDLLPEVDGDQKGKDIMNFLENSKY